MQIHVAYTITILLVVLTCKKRQQRVYLRGIYTDINELSRFPQRCKTSTNVVAGVFEVLKFLHSTTIDSTSTMEIGDGC